MPLFDELSGGGQEGGPLRVIIDTDPGIDDTMALFLAFASPELTVEGLTIVMGNHNDQVLAHARESLL